MMQAIIGVLCGIGLFFILVDVYKIPYYKTSKAVESLSKKQKDKKSGLDIWLSGIAEGLSRHIRINEFKRAELEADLKTAQIDISPEMFKANAIVKRSRSRSKSILMKNFRRQKHEKENHTCNHFRGIRARFDRSFTHNRVYRRKSTGNSVIRTRYNVV